MHLDLTVVDLRYSEDLGGVHPSDRTTQPEDGLCQTLPLGILFPEQSTGGGRCKC